MEACAHVTPNTDKLALNTSFFTHLYSALSAFLPTSIRPCVNTSKARPCVYSQYVYLLKHVDCLNHVFRTSTSTEIELAGCLFPGTTSLSRPHGCVSCGGVAHLDAPTITRGCAGESMDPAGIDLDRLRILSQAPGAH